MTNFLFFIERACSDPLIKEHVLNDVGTLLFEEVKRDRPGPIDDPEAFVEEMLRRMLRLARK
jgi:hypothetical protein